MSVVASMVLHVLLELWTGLCVLHFLQGQRYTGENLAAAFVLGLYTETMVVGILCFGGSSVRFATVTFYILLLIVTAWGFKRFRWGASHRIRIRLYWYEWAVILAVCVKVTFACWQLAALPLCFDDAVSTWSGRARALYGGVNWSFNPESSHYLGHIGQEHYPFCISIRRAIGAVLGGGWHEAISRVDSLLFFVVGPLALWHAVWRSCASRPLAAAAVFVLTTLPLQAWHAAGGYADIGIQAVFIVALGAILRGEWLLAGLLTATTGWIKNDALVIAIPGLTVTAILLIHTGWEDSTPLWRTNRRRVKNMAAFLVGLTSLIPWLAFKVFFNLGIYPGDKALSWHPEAVSLLWHFVMIGPTHSIFFIAAGFLLVASAWSLLHNRNGRSVLAGMLVSVTAVFFVFIATDAYRFLADQTTIHRSLLQLYGGLILLICLGVSASEPNHR